MVFVFDIELSFVKLVKDKIIIPTKTAQLEILANNPNIKKVNKLEFASI
jgi:hypothetical protein